MNSSLFASRNDRCGVLVARALAGCWRALPPPWDLSPEELDQVGLLLLNSGMAGLVWWRLRTARGAMGRWAHRLHQAARALALQALRYEHQLARAIAFFQEAGIEPIVGKGWAAARLYAEPSLRPRGDVDLYIPRERHGKALALMRDPRFPPCPVDLHAGFAELDDRSEEELYARSQRFRLGEVWIHVFGPEDHLRLLALHLLRHGARHPLALCDVAAALEARPPDFDWDRLLSGDRRRSEWVKSALALAHTVLGAEIEGIPVELPSPPVWMLSTVLREWGRPFRPRAPLELVLRSPRRLLDELMRKWPNPIEATITARGSFDSGPRLPLQLADCVIRAGRWLQRISRRSEGV